jgi:hypothetical protein
MAVTIHGKEYEEVKDRIQVFYDRYPNGRILTEILSESEKHVTIKASIYSDPEEQLNSCPLSTGIAREERGGEISKYTENAETSAIGRAFANRHIYGDIAQQNGTRPSAEEMVSAIQQEKSQAAPEATAPVGNYDDGQRAKEIASAEAFGETPNIPAPTCDKCGGAMVKRTRKSDGKEFWGCSNWAPSGGCDGTQEVGTFD